MDGDQHRPGGENFNPVFRRHKLVLYSSSSDMFDRDDNPQTKNHRKDHKSTEFRSTHRHMVNTHTLYWRKFFYNPPEKNFFQIYLPFNVSARSRLVYAHSGLQDETTRREFSSLETEFFFAPKVVQPRSKRNGGQMECCSNEEHLLIVCWERHVRVLFVLSPVEGNHYLIKMRSWMRRKSEYLRLKL